MLIQWNRDSDKSYCGLEINRKGDQNLPVKLEFVPENSKDCYRLDPQLAAVLDMSKGSRLQILMAIWNYIKFHGLLNADEKRWIRCNKQLSELFGADRVFFPTIPDRINHLLLPPDPVIIDYTIRYLHLSLLIQKG